MKEIAETSTIIVYDNFSQLSSIEQTVLKKAIDMLDCVYAPYSKFYIGAAALTDEGNIYGGCTRKMLLSFMYLWRKSSSI